MGISAMLGVTEVRLLTIGQQGQGYVTVTSHKRVCYRAPQNYLGVITYSPEQLHIFFKASCDASKGHFPSGTCTSVALHELCHLIHGSCYA